MSILWLLPCVPPQLSNHDSREIYTLTGPIYIWQAVMVVQLACIVAWAVFYRKMVSNTRRLQMIRSRQQRIFPVLVLKVNEDT